MRRVDSLAALAVACLAAAVAAAPASAQSFVFGCDYSHTAEVDPIVAPGVRPGSHSHDFLGNATTDEDSTRGTLRQGTTSCEVYGDRTADLSAYWVPSLFQRRADGSFEHIPAYHATIYYTSAVSNPTTVEPFPEGLKVIAGDASAPASQPRRVLFWDCFGETNVNGGPWCVDNPANPGLPAAMYAQIYFPSCWNGRDLYRADRSHMTYPVKAAQGASVCPVTHPHPVPEIQLIAKYRSPGGPDAVAADQNGTPRPGDVKLAAVACHDHDQNPRTPKRCNGQHTMHADFFEAWDQLKLRYQIARCIWVASDGCTDGKSLPSWLGLGL